MTNTVLLPPTIVNVATPIIFLAGPIQGADDWQTRAIKIIHDINPHITIASPRRQALSETFVWEDQVDWETHYLRAAGKSGAILFWLAKETHHDCSRPFALTSRFEIAEWKMRHERDNARLVIGVDSEFVGARYIKHRFSQDCPDVPICDSLEETCKKAVEVISLRHDAE